MRHRAEFPAPAKNCGRFGEDHRGGYFSGDARPGAAPGGESGLGECRAGGRLAFLDAKYPDRPPVWTAVFPRWREQSFGIDPKFLSQRPMDSIRRHMQETPFREYFFGYLYLSVGRTKRTAV